MQRFVDLLTRRWWLTVLVVAVGLFALIQLVPYRVDNPPVVNEPNWDSPQTRALAVAACFDCHSNETRYPWYAYITPVNWWLQKSHIEHGRHHVNFNEWGTYSAEDRAEVVEEGLELLKEGEMPVPSYTWLHADARLADSTRHELVAFFAALR